MYTRVVFVTLRDGICEERHARHGASWPTRPSRRPDGRLLKFGTIYLTSLPALRKFSLTRQEFDYTGSPEFAVYAGTATARALFTHGNVLLLAGKRGFPFGMAITHIGHGLVLQPVISGGFVASIFCPECGRKNVHHTSRVAFFPGQTVVRKYSFGTPRQVG